MKNKNIIIGIATVVLIIGAFFVGKSYGASHASGAMATDAVGRYGRTGMNGTGAAGGFAGRAGGATIGQVVSKDATSMTVAIPGGGSKIVLYAPSTTISKSVTGTVNDIAIGATITAMGTANPDGSVTATAIQIRPAPQQ